MDIDNRLNELCDRMLKSWKSEPGVLSPFSSSSSQHNEQSDNHLEHYVTGSGTSSNEDVSGIFNSNSTNGGTQMENTQYETPAAVTTEPDAMSEIAITKVIDQVTRPEENVSVSDAPEGPVPTNETFTGEGSAVAPTSEEMAEAEIEKSDATKCESCGQALPMKKSADEAETPAEDAKETPADEAKEEKEMKKSVWGGAFAPRINGKL